MSFENGDFQVKELYIPPIAEAVEFLQERLSQHFKQATVRECACPDLRREPFGLASEGLGGNPFILQVGGVRNLLPIANKKKIYDLRSVAEVCAPKLSIPPKISLLGAGAGPYRLLGRNSECVINFSVDHSGNTAACACHNFVAQLQSSDKYDCSEFKEPQISFLGDFFASQGVAGNVLQLKLKQRISDKASDLISLLRELLIEKYGSERSIGLGGTILLKSGKAKLHIMQPDLPDDAPIDTSNFLVMFDMEAPLVGLGMLVTNDCGMKLRDVHVHMFNASGRAGGHYHDDVTPEEVEYEAYLAFAERAVHLDSSE